MCKGALQQFLIVNSFSALFLVTCSPFLKIYHLPTLLLLFLYNTHLSLYCLN